MARKAYKPVLLSNAVAEKNERKLAALGAPRKIVKQVHRTPAAYYLDCTDCANTLENEVSGGVMFYPGDVEPGEILICPVCKCPNQVPVLF